MTLDISTLPGTPVCDNGLYEGDEYLYFEHGSIVGRLPVIPLRNSTQVESGFRLIAAGADPSGGSLTVGVTYEQTIGLDIGLKAIWSRTQWLALASPTDRHWRPYNGAETWVPA